MKVIVLGTGFVGLTHAAVLAERRLDIVACDIDREKIAAFASGRSDAIEHYVSEPGLSASVRQGLESGCLQFSTEVEQHLPDADALFLCLPTPAGARGATSLTFYRAAIARLIEALQSAPRSRRLLLVNKSTVPIGTARGLADAMRAAGLSNVGVASNPEFLPQGEAVEASRNPSRIVVGTRASEDLAILRHIYAPFVDRPGVRYLETTAETAEAVKYVSNALLFTYVSFWNGIAARVAENIGEVRMNDLRQGVTSDPRLSTWGSSVGNGAGGSCFGKDLRSLVHQMDALGLPTDLLEQVLAINETQKVYLVDRAEQELGFSFEGKTVAVAGLAFKKNTNDLRDSAAISLIEALLARGVRAIHAYDPIVTAASARKQLARDKSRVLDRVTFFTRCEDALRDTHALFISNDSDEFAALTPIILGTVKPPYAIIDGRRMIHDPQPLLDTGFHYLCVGAPAWPLVKGKATKEVAA